MTVALIILGAFLLVIVGSLACLLCSRPPTWYEDMPPVDPSSPEKPYHEDDY